MEAKKSAFRFLDFLIEKSHFEQSPSSSGDAEFDLQITPAGVISREKKKFQLTLKFEINAKDESFKCEVIAIGLFEFEEISEKKDLSSYFYANAPAILFPYIRAYISSLTALSGMKTISMPTLNLASIRPELEKNTIED